MKQPLSIASTINLNKIESDIRFLGALIEFTKSHSWRPVVYGGYGLDGYLRTITRSHGDVDVVMYGQSNRQTAEDLLKSFLESQLENAQIVVKPEPFLLELAVKGTNFVGNLYYVETVQDPLQDLTQVRKGDGEVVSNNTNDFPLPLIGKLGDLTVEVQDQNAHLKDIIRKRESSTREFKHDQDIANIHSALSL
jgi:hypothetical protein